MNHKFLLDISPTGVQHRAYVEDDGGTLITEEFTPTKIESEIIDNCARLREMTQRKGSGFRHAAQIPIGLHALWKKEWREKYKDTWTWPTFLAMKLNSSDYKKLRTGVNKL